MSRPVPRQTRQGSENPNWPWLVVTMPWLAHLAQPRGADAPPTEKVDDETARKRFNDMLKLPPPEE